MMRKPAADYELEPRQGLLAHEQALRGGLRRNRCAGARAHQGNGQSDSEEFEAGDFDFAGRCDQQCRPKSVRNPPTLVEAESSLGGP